MAEITTRFTETSDSTFETDVLRNTKPVVVGVWASWSQPSTLNATVFGDLEEQFRDLVAVRTLNVDDCPLTASNFELTTLPTMLLFKDGQLIRQLAGATPRKTLQKLFEDALALE